MISILFKWIKWKLLGSPIIQYLGFHCGCCGKYVREPFTVPTYKSDGSWMDTWGLCNECGSQRLGV